ncbi:MAG TPA: choice-of-anchor D domain-containing protein, partial [Mycobacteriales bacterium]|nr:choice-of-anchor D domain-containing protein [Mycobacteriales bacterium]
MSSLAFATQLTAASATQRITVTNTGSAPLNVSSITQPPGYGIVTTCLSAVAPAGTCTIDVTFSAATGGSFNGNVVINSNASNASTYTVAVTGISMDPPVFSIGTFTSRTPGQVSTVTVNIFEPATNPVAYSGISVQLDYPGGFVHDPSIAVQTSCAASVSTVGSPTVTGIAATGGRVAPSSSCGVVGSQLFAPTTPGTYTFTVPAGGLTITSPFAYSNPSPITATVTVAVAPAPAASLSPTSIGFTAQNVGTSSASQPVTLTNTGNATLNVSSIGVTGDFTQANACPATIAPSGTCTINVAFSPTAPGTRIGSLSVATNAAGSPHTVLLGGTGVTLAPAVTVTPSSLAFAARSISTTSPPQTVTLANTGTAPLSIASIIATGDFAFTSVCGSAVASGGSCTIDVTFTPLVTGPRTGNLAITDNASGSPHNVPLAGSGLSGSAAVASISPSAVDFPPQPVGSDSDPQLITVTNSGTAPLTFAAVGVTGEFAIITPTGTTPPQCPVTLLPAASCIVEVIFRPVGTNLRQGVLTIATNGGGVNVPVIGTGLIPEAPQLVVPSSVDFGPQPVGTHGAGIPVPLHNVSTNVATITDLAASGDFTVSDTCTSIGPGATCSPLVTFQPSALGSRVGTLTVRTLRDARPYTVNLGGIGIENRFPSLDVSVTRLGFGNTFMGGAVRHDVTLRNIGLATLQVSGILFTGDFFSDGTCVGSLAPRESCTVTVMFAPAIPGTQGG